MKIKGRILGKWSPGYERFPSHVLIGDSCRSCEMWGYDVMWDVRLEPRGARVSFPRHTSRWVFLTKCIKHYCPKCPSNIMNKINLICNTTKIFCLCRSWVIIKLNQTKKNYPPIVDKCILWKNHWNKRITTIKKCFAKIFWRNLWLGSNIIHDLKRQNSKYHNKW
jgi:hypothetical protein